MNTFLQDLRFGIRTLAKNPGFAVVAILTLALGIGASTAIFSVVDAVLLRPLPYPSPQQMVTVREQEAHGHQARLADPNFLDFRSQNHTLSGLATFASGPESVSGGSEPIRMDVGYISQDFFKVMGVEPFRGREFAPAELVEHGAPAIIVSYSYWRDFLGAKNDLSRVRLAMDGTAYSVIGVMPQGFDFPAGVSAWIATERFGWSKSRDSHNGEGIGRLRDGVTLEQARADLDTIARRIHAEYGKTENPDYFLQDAVVTPLADEMVGKIRPALLTLFGAVIVLFLVASANVAGLILARTSARRKELAVRAALGAGRGRLVQQLLAESLALAVAGGVLGTLFAVWTTSILPAILPADLPRQQGVTINGVVLLFTLVATLAVAVGLGVFAAWRAGGVDLNDALSAGSRGYSSGSQKARSALVIGEIAATLMLLVGAGLLGRSFLLLVSVNPGFNGQNLLVMQFSAPLSYDQTTFQANPADIVRQTHFLDDALARVRAIPGVQSAGVTGALPIADPDGFPDGLFLILNGQPLPTNIEQLRPMWLNPKQTGTADYAVAGAEFFQAAEIPLVRGRLFGPQDGIDTPNVALITQTLAREKWPNRDPVGQQIFFGNMDGIMKPLTIVGVVGDIRAQGLDQPASPVIFVDYRQRGLGGNSAPAIVLRSSLPPSAVIPSVRTIFRQLNPNIPVEFSTYVEALGGWMAQRSFLLLLAGVFAGAALLLAAVGIYGLVANSVTRRTQEIGIRLALGAQRGDVLRLIVGESARLAAIGLVIGIALSLAATQLISSLLYGVKATDPLTFLVVAVILSVVALLASYIPARRAMRLDPMIALRYE
ncbi:MAG TPA: ABC transporter permease [Candidatus Acidoferrales bacterium]|nr:ABC transporter permease [Candidatus Acidoferrales bacterium]